MGAAYEPDQCRRTTWLANFGFPSDPVIPWRGSTVVEWRSFNPMGMQRT